MTSRDATFSGLRLAVELRPIPTAIPTTKMAANPKIAIGAKLKEKGEGLEPEGCSLGIVLDLDLRFIFAYVNLSENW
jgi:hypothetical protein